MERNEGDEGLEMNVSHTVVTEQEQMPDLGAMDRAAVVEGFGDLPTLAPVAMQVLELAENDNASMTDIAEVMSSDPGLASRLLRLANSAAYSRGRQVVNLNQAAVLIGMQTLKMMALGFTVVADLTTGRFDSSIVWRRSLAGSVLAREIATRQRPELADDAFVAGLLANIGKFAMADHDPYIDALERYGLWLTPADERQLFGFTTDEITGDVLESWELPVPLVEATRGRSLEVGDPEQGELAKILQVADHTARLILIEDDAGKARAIDELTMSAAMHLGMTVGDIEMLVQDMHEDLEEIAATFELESINQTPVEQIIATAQSHLVRISLEVATNLTEQKRQNEELVEVNRELEAAASTDALTGLPNRRTFDAYLANQIAGRLRSPRSTMLGLVIFDLDHFKSINDTYGHGVGDEVLQEFGRRLTANSRRGELAARIGGEEFALILPDVTSAEATGAAERMRSLVGADPVDTEVGPLAVTASVGVSYTTVTRADAEQALYAAADAALYESKNGGRDRVTARGLD